MLPKIENIPILFLSGLKDEMIPYVFHLSLVSKNENDISD